MGNLTSETTNYQVNGLDLGIGIVTKEYLIAVYPKFSAQFKTAGLWVWGVNSSGQLGTNNLVHRSSPVQTIAGGTDWVQIASGSSHCGGIKSNGSLWMWGTNGSGQLGANNTTSRSSPVQTIGTLPWAQLSVGGTHSAATKADGTLWLWGLNTSGQLGANNTTSRSSPVQTVLTGTDWKQVSCGGDNTAAVKIGGTLWTWGTNFNGQLGTNDRTGRSSPVQTVSAGTTWKSVSVSDALTATTVTMGAIKTDGTLWLWGSNANGKLGTNDQVHRSSPIQTVSGGNNWKSVSCGEFHVAAIKTDGTLWTWGANSSGELGTGDIVHTSSPVQTIAGGTNWLQVSVGTNSTATIKTDGTLWLWGTGTLGALGTNNINSRSSPVQTVTGGYNWKSVTTGDNTTLAIRDDSDDPF